MGFRADEVVTWMTDAPNIWTAWSLVHLQLALGFISHLSEQHWGSRSWAHVDGLEGESEGCSPVGVIAMFLVLRKLFRELSFGRSFLPCKLLMLYTLEVDNLNAVRHVGRLIDGNPGSCSVELLKDGDLILLIDRMLEKVAGVRFVLAR